MQGGRGEVGMTGLRGGAGLLALFFLCCPPLFAAPAEVVIVHDPSLPYHRALVEVLADELRVTGKILPHVMAGGDGRLREVLKGADLTIAVGSQSARVVEAIPSTRPRLYTLLPLSVAEELLLQDGSWRAPAIVVDQPLPRIVRLIRAALPDARRLGSLHGPTSRRYIPLLREAAAQRSLQLKTAEVAVDESLAEVLKPLLKGSDALLALPDEQVVNPATARAILTSAYAGGVPLVGYSQAFVKGGALCGVYSTPQQIGRQTAELAERLLSGRVVAPALFYPRYFSVSINFQVARSMGISMPNEEELWASLTQAEGGAE